MEDEIDFIEPDDLEENTGMEQRRAGNTWGKMFMWEVGIGCGLYFGLQLSNWLIGFPRSLKDAGGVIFSILGILIGISILSVIVAFIDSTIKEFRIRSRQMNHRLTEIEAKIESMTERINR
jgi:hypothetical protein